MTRLLIRIAMMSGVNVKILFVFHSDIYTAYTDSLFITVLKAQKVLFSPRLNILNLGHLNLYLYVVEVDE